MTTNDMTARYNPTAHTAATAEPPAQATDTETFPHRAGKTGGQGATFADLGLLPMLLDAVKAEGYTTPTPIQAATIPAGIAGKDVLGTAQTGTGKTAAFALPILHRLQQSPTDKSHRGPVIPRALILSPTRELASQIAESFATYGRNTALRYTTVFGGVSQFHQVKALRNGVDILIATPGRLMDLMGQRLVNLASVSIFVLDEADRMLDMGFIDPIRQIAAALPAREKVNRQTMLFSATMPREIVHLAESLLKDPLRIAVSAANSTVDRIEQSLYVVPKEKKAYLLEHLLQEGSIVRAVVFTRTKHGAERLGRRLNQAGISAESIHGDKNQNARKRALGLFKDGRSRVLVATDVAARGLDIDDITHVFNFDLPFEPESYVHRIGRTARAGAKGTAISFADPSEHGLLRAIERLIKARIRQVERLPDLRERMSADRERQNAGAETGGRPTEHANSGDRGSYASHAPRTPHRRTAPHGDSRPHGERPGTGYATRQGAAPHQPAAPNQAQAHGTQAHAPRREPRPAPHGGHRPGAGVRVRRDQVPSTLADQKGQGAGKPEAAGAQPRPQARPRQAGGQGGHKPPGQGRPGGKPAWAGKGRGRKPGRGAGPRAGR